MRKLILTRHAKSSWDDPLLGDHDRVLNARGRASAPQIATWLRDAGHCPDEVISSTAVRAIETTQLMCDIFGFAGEMDLRGGLYHASSDAILKHLSRASGETVLIVGHNPGIADFAHRLISGTPDHPRFSDYPTGATLVAAFDGVTWKDVRFGAMQYLDFRIPRDLEPA